MQERPLPPYASGFGEQMQHVDTSSVGRLLVRLSSLGLVLLAIALLGFGFLWRALGLGGAPMPGTDSLFAAMLLVNAPLAVTGAWLLYRVREVGVLLRGPEPMSAMLGLAFWNLRNALVVATLVGFTCGSFDPVVEATGVTYRVNLEFGTLLLGAIAAVMAHGVAKLVVRATRLREDAEGFV